MRHCHVNTPAECLQHGVNIYTIHFHVMIDWAIDCKYLCTYNTQGGCIIFMKCLNLQCVLPTVFLFIWLTPRETKVNIIPWGLVHRLYVERNDIRLHVYGAWHNTVLWPNLQQIQSGRIRLVASGEGETSLNAPVSYGKLAAALQVLVYVVNIRNI